MNATISKRKCHFGDRHCREPFRGFVIPPHSIEEPKFILVCPDCASKYRNMIVLYGVFTELDEMIWRWYGGLLENVLL